MNRNSKEKISRIEIRVKANEKQRILSTAKRCGLSVSEYMVKRALGYEPRAVPPDAFFRFYDVLCQLANQGPSPETEARLLDLIDRIQTELLLPGKEDLRKWQRPDSGPSVGT